MPSRRAALGAAGGLLAVAAAGCLGGSAPDRARWTGSPSGSLRRVDDALYVSDRNGESVAALEPADGTERWTTGFDTDRPVCVGGDLAADDDRLYVPGCDGLRALSRSDGAPRWTAPGETGSVAVADGTVYAKRTDLVALDAADGTTVWRAPVGGSIPTRPAVAPGVVVAVNREDGAVRAFERDGTERWTHRTGAETRAPAAVDGTVYVAAGSPPGDGRLIALDPADGTVRWRAETPFPKRGERPVVGDERVFLGCSGSDAGRLVVHDRADGRRLWSYADDNGAVYRPAVAGGQVYAGSNDDTVTAFDRDGTRRWRVETDGVVGSVAADDERVYAATNERLLALARD